MTTDAADREDDEQDRERQHSPEQHLRAQPAQVKSGRRQMHPEKAPRRLESSWLRQV